MLLSSLQFYVPVVIFGSIYCTSNISNPTPVYVVQGGEAVLQCGFESSRLAWRVYNGDDANMVANDSLTIDVSKYSVSTNPSTGLYYRLHILNVGVSDLEKYRCSGLVNGVSRAFYLKLDILLPPSSLNIENVTPGNNRLLGTEGQDLSVSCIAVGGKPTPNVILIIDGQSVASQTQTAQYTLNIIDRSYDHKTVTCQASNPAYSQNSLTDTAVIYLNLRPLSLTITGYAGRIEETKPLVVTCTTTGSRPKATLEWTIGQKDVTSDATERFSHITASDTYTVITDLKYSVGKSDNGQMLTCKAVNMAASSGVHTSISLNVKCPPQTPTNFTLVSSTDTSIVVEWISGYNGGHEQTFNIQYRIVNESKTWFTQHIPHYNKQTYTLLGLQGDTRYELRMFAENKFDRSSVTDIQSISTVPSLEKEAPESSNLYGGVIGGVVGAMIIVMLILGIIYFKGKKGLLDGRDKTKSNRNKVTAADNPNTNDAYEYIEGATSNQRKKDPRDMRVETP